MSIDINKMVSNFLSWKLPSDFSPDAGISFDKHAFANHTFEPIGTNLFTSVQAKAMIEAMLIGAVDDQAATIAQLTAENEKLREALEKYANGENILQVIESCGETQIRYDASFADKALGKGK